MQNDNLHSFLALRANPKALTIDSGGYWSYPALIVKGKSLQWICLILPTAPMREKKRTALFRPKSMVVLKAESPVIVRYENFRLGCDPFPDSEWNVPIGMFPHKSLWGMTYLQLKKAENQLMMSYAEAGKTFLNEGALPESFVKLYLNLLHPVFLPFLRELAPKFVATLEPGLAGIASAHE